MTDPDALEGMTAATEASRWTNGKPWVATEKDCVMDWGGRKNGAKFRCFSCGHKFVAGDVVRWQFTSDVPGAGGNPFVCQSCDTGKAGIVAQIIRRRAELRSDQWWWFL